MSNSASTAASTAASTDASTAAAWAAVKAEEKRQESLAVEKMRREFEKSINEEVATLSSKPPGNVPTRFSTWEGGSKRKRTTGTKKMKRRHARKSHRKSKRVMKR